MGHTKAHADQHTYGGYDPVIAARGVQIEDTGILTKLSEEIILKSFDEDCANACHAGSRTKL